MAPSVIAGVALTGRRIAPRAPRAPRPLPAARAADAVDASPAASAGGLRVTPLLVVALLASCASRASAAAVAWHDDSASRTLLVVEGTRVSHFVKLQTLSIAEVLPLDADGNGLATDAELAAVREDLVAYLVSHYALRPVGTEGPGALLPADAIEVRLVTDDQDALAFSQWIELELERRAPAPFSRLAVESTLFLDTSPGHRDRLDALWVDEHRAPDAGLAGARWSDELWAGNPRLLLDSGRRTLVERVGEAAVRARRWPQLAGCLVLLLLACARRRGWLGVAGAWLGASVVGALVPRALLGGLPALPLASWLALMALGAVAALRPRPRPVLLEAVVVGLIAGLALQPMASASAPGIDDALATRLLAACVLGVVGTLAALLARFLPGRRAPDQPVPAWVSRALGGLAVALGSLSAWPLFT